MNTPTAKGPGRLHLTDREHDLCIFAVYREMAKDSLREARYARKNEPWLVEMLLRHAREHGASARERFSKLQAAA